MNSLVAQDVPSLGNRSFFDDPIMRVAAQAGDKEDALLGQAFKPGIVYIGAIENENGSGLKAQAARHLDFLYLARCGHYQLRQVALMVEDQMELGGTFGALVGGPIVQRGAKVDHSAAEGEERIAEAKTAGGARQALATVKQLLEDTLVELSGTMLVGIGEGGALGRLRNTEMTKLALAGSQAPTDFAQGLSPSQLTKSMATNCPQQVKPRAWRSARC